MSQERMLQLLHELIKNSKRSDRDLAKIVGVSQPTLTRMRRKLERENFIMDYTAIPNMAKLGFEIVAFTFVNIDEFNPKTGELDDVLEEKARKWITHHSKIIFAAGGEGLEGKNCVIVSVHRNFTDFSRFISEFRTHWASRMKDMDNFLVSLKGKMPKMFSFRNLEITKR